MDHSCYLFVRSKLIRRARIAEPLVKSVLARAAEAIGGRAV
jgi:hypothetical protein